MELKGRRYEMLLGSNLTNDGTCQDLWYITVHPQVLVLHTF